MTAKTYRLQQPARSTVVKWTTPAEEVRGIALVINSLINEANRDPERIGIAVPNHNWAAQMHYACRCADFPSTDCLPPARLNSEAQAALAKLDILAHHTTKETRIALAELGHPHQGMQHTIEELGPSCGFTLVQALGIDDIPLFAHARLHLHGDEDAQTLLDILKQQIVHPTMPDHASVTPIMHYRNVEGAFDWLFLIGCVDGLLPGSDAFEAPTEQERSQARDSCQSDFNAACSHAYEQIVISYFTKIDAEIAKKASIRTTRFRTEGDRRFAMTAPTVLLNHQENHRPTTVGGQILLRTYGLN